MELIGSIFLILALALLVGLFIARPFITSLTGERAPEAVTETEREHLRSSLLAERDRVLNALQELDFDFALGKVPAEEYPQQRAVLLKAGADTLRKLDEMAADDVTGRGTGAQTAEDRVEAAVAARRADAAQRSSDAAQRSGTARKSGSAQPVEAAEPVGEAVGAGSTPRTNGHRKDELEEIIASRKRVRKESTAGFCPRCGKPASKSDKFCSRCGAPL